MSLFENISGAAKILRSLLQDATSSQKGPIQLTGDLGGTAGSPSVVKANGASIPAAGSLTTGNVPQVTGSSALGYAAVNLAGGSNFVTGTLPTGNQAAQSMGGDISGTTAAATVTTLTGTANAVSIPAATHVSHGTTVAATGTFRLANADSVKARDVTNAVDLNLISCDSSNNIEMGAAAVNTSRVRCSSSGTIEFNINNVDMAKFNQHGLLINDTSPPSTPSGAGEIYSSSGHALWLDSGGFISNLSDLGAELATTAVELRRLQYRAIKHTTGAQTLTIFTLSNSSFSSFCDITIDAQFDGRDTGAGARFFAKRYACFHKESGTMSQDGSTETIGTDKGSLVGSGIAVAIAVSSTNIVLSVTTVGGQSVDWAMFINVMINGIA